MEKPLVSIVIPLYNKADYIEQCLRSLVAQTLQNIEVIVVDNGSTDESGVIAKAFCRSDERFTYLWQENWGISRALNLGIAKATGTYLARIDADDWVDSDMYERLVEVAAAYQAPHVRCGYVREFVKGEAEYARTISKKRPVTEELVETHGLFCFKKLFGEVFVPLMSTCFGIIEREAVVEAGISFPDKLSNLEDLYFNARFFSQDTPIVLIPECFYHYRDNPESLSQKIEITLPEQLGHFEELIQNEVLDENPELAGQFAHYRAIAVLTTAADMAPFKSAGMRALAESAMYTALREEKDRSYYPKSLLTLMGLLNTRQYPLAMVYAKSLKSARAVRRMMR